MRGALSYNEQKVRQEKAELILASRFGVDINQLGFSQKLRRFMELNQNSTKVKNNTVHISLNFSPEDKLDSELMGRIAVDYMKRIGFANQPFLVYRHTDTTHPHIHIVSSPIRTTGRTINLHNIARRKSEPARKAIEQEYQLIQAEAKRFTISIPLVPVVLGAADYGKAETKHAISNIVGQVVSQYKYSSLEDLNAVLRQYNIMADPGKPEGFIQKHRGLIYSIVDSDGYKCGIPIKSSAIYGSPTLKRLEKRFARNTIRKIASTRFLKNKVLFALGSGHGKAAFTEGLKSGNVGCTVFRNSKGTIQDIYFIDHRFKSVASSKELGLPVPELLKRINYQPDQSISEVERVSDAQINPAFDWIRTLLASEYSGPDLSPEFLKKKRKKKNKP
jgi:hypothetical protein